MKFCEKKKTYHYSAIDNNYAKKEKKRKIK